MSPTCPILKFGKCKDKDCSHEAFAGITQGDIAVGDYVVGQHVPDKLPKPMTSPREMTPAEWALHRITHLPYNGSCPHCLAGKRNHPPHCRSRTERNLPHLVADYCYLRDSISDVTLTTLVVYVLPFRIYFVTVVDAKVPTPTVVKRLSRLVRELGLTHYTYRSDRELALRNLLRAAALEAGIPDANIEDLSVDVPAAPAPLDQPVQGAAVPEESAPGESQSNGAAERAVQLVEDQVRTLKLALEHQIGVKVPMEHPIMMWLIEHAAMTLTNFHPGSDDNLTGYERLHGHAYNARMPEFGESIMWYVPKAVRHKLDPRWRLGCFLGVLLEQRRELHHDQRRLCGQGRSYDKAGRIEKVVGGRT